MKTIKYILIFAIGIFTFSSCLIDEDEIHTANGEGVNVVTFNRTVDNLNGVAETGGVEYTFLKTLRVEGPTVSELTNDIVVNIEVAEGSTADGTMYRINNNPITLKKSENYLGHMSITLTTLGNEPPKDGTPEADAYVAPILKLKFAPTGEDNVVGSGKGGTYTLNFTPPNPWAGDYDSYIEYRRPGDGATGVYPDNLNGISGHYEKTLVGLTANRLEVSSYGPFEYGAEGLSWITINPDNSVLYQVDDDWWGLANVMGDPNRPDLVSHFDPDTRIIQIYYHYVGGTGDRIFWETFTPLF